MQPVANETSTGKPSYASRVDDAEGRRQEIERNALPDAKIDLSDIPELTDEQLSEFVHGPWTPLEERTVKLRIDAEVFEWLQSAGPETAKKINLVLKREAQRAKRRVGRATSALAKAS